MRSRAVAAAVVLVVAACGGSTSGREETVFEELNLLVTDLPATLERFEQMERAISEDAAICMQEQGYPYVAWTVEDERQTATDVEATSLSPEAWAEVNGYGLMPRFSVNILSHPSARRDPNFVYLDGLSEEEARVYFGTLLGANSGQARSAGVDEELYKAGGCLGQALETHAPEDLFQDVGGDELHNDWLALEERVNSDERFADYDGTWSACMAEQGFTYTSSPDARDAFQAHYDRIWAMVEFPSAAYDREGLRELTAAEREALYAQDPIYDRQEVDQLVEEEIATAVADLGCQGDAPRQDLFLTILVDYEAEFIEAHSAVIDPEG